MTPEKTQGPDELHTSLGNATQTVPPASISFLFCGLTLTTTLTALLALSPPPPPAAKPPAAMPLPLGVFRSLSALDSDPAVEGAGERRPGVRALVGKGGVAMFSLEHELCCKAPAQQQRAADLLLMHLLAWQTRSGKGERQQRSA